MQRPGWEQDLLFNDAPSIYPATLLNSEIKYYIEAADAGNGFAARDLGCYYCTSWCNFDFEKAIFYCELAESLGVGYMGNWIQAAKFNLKNSKKKK